MKKIFLFMAASLAAVLTFAQAPQELPNDPAVKVGKLDNGMTYYIRHNDKPAQRAEFYLGTDVGAIQENPEQDGLAHFMEHMCFNGTKNFPDKGILDYLQSIGASFGGNVNASTGEEETIYMLNNIPLVRPGVVDTCLLIMHDYSHFVTCDPVEIDKERGVIMEEKRSRNTADWRVYEKMEKYLFKGSKYADCTVIGSYENLQNFKPETLVDFYHTWYRPDLQTLVVVGDIDVDEVEAKIHSIFADIPAVENPEPKVMPVVPDNDEPIVGIITDPEQSSTECEILWKIEKMPKEYNSTTVGFLNTLIRRYISTIMSERFRDITASPDAPFLSGRLYVDSYFTRNLETIDCEFTLRDGEIVPALTAFMTEVEKMRRYGFSEDEVARAKDNILASYEKAAEAAPTRKNSEFIMPLLYHALFNYPYMEPETAYELAQQFCSIISPEILNPYIAQLIPENNMIVIYCAPEKSELPTEEQLLAVINEVKASEIEPNAVESIDTQLIEPDALKGGAVVSQKDGILDGGVEWVLDNGVKVYVLPTEYKKDEVIINLSKEGGETLIATEDLASFDATVSATFENLAGIADFPKTILNKMLAGNTANVRFSLSDIWHGINATCSPKDVETALQLLYLKYVQPRFDPDEWNTAMGRLQALLPNMLTTPNFVFVKEIRSATYGDNPREQFTSEKTLEDASLETYERVYRDVLFKDAAGAVVYIVGNVDVETLKPLVEKYVGSLPAGGEPTPYIFENYAQRQTGHIVNDFTTTMESPQVTVRNIFMTFEPYSVKAEVIYDAIGYIMDMIYVDTLREEEGGTYSPATAGQVLRTPISTMLFLVQFMTNTEQAEGLRKMAMGELHKLADNGPSEEYFSRTIENFKKEIPEERIRNSYWMSVLKNYDRYDGELYDSLYEQAVNELTPQDIQTALQELLASGNLVEVVMRPDVVEAMEVEAAETEPEEDDAESGATESETESEAEQVETELSWVGAAE